MKPPFCIICSEPVEDMKMGLVSFHKRESDIAWDKQVEDEGITGHPPYCEWFCELHKKTAHKFSTLSIDLAIKKITSGK